MDTSSPQGHILIALHPNSNSCVTFQWPILFKIKTDRVDIKKGFSPKATNLSVTFGRKIVVLKSNDTLWSLLLQYDGFFFSRPKKWYLLILDYNVKCATTFQPVKKETHPTAFLFSHKQWKLTSETFLKKIPNNFCYRPWISFSESKINVLVEKEDERMEKDWVIQSENGLFVPRGKQGIAALLL